MKTIRIAGHPNLRRDGYSNAVVNTDVRAYEQARARQHTQTAQEQRLTSLENDVREIKELLNILIQHTDINGK